jgi:hypothetical protein
MLPNEAIDKYVLIIATASSSVFCAYAKHTPISACSLGLGIIIQYLITEDK